MTKIYSEKCAIFAQYTVKMQCLPNAPTDTNAQTNATKIENEFILLTPNVCRLRRVEEKIDCATSSTPQHQHFLTNSNRADIGVEGLVQARLPSVSFGFCSWSSALQDIINSSR